MQRIVDAIRVSRRYRRLDETLVRRSAAQALTTSGGHVGDAIKRTKRHLHQVLGAYVGMPPRYDRLLARVREAHASGDDAFRSELRRVMAAHASTRERLPYLEEMYAAVFRRAGPVKTLLDVGCGLNPLGAPWMTLEPGAEYIAVDVDADVVAFAAACLEVMGYRPRAIVADVISSPPEQEADVALALKMLPCLERQETGAGARLLRAVRARLIAVSFPVRSLGGREKGMREQYSRLFDEMARAERWDVETVPLAQELLFLVRVRARA
jgi:16S rRNA (guanine(1405)-N(7))-methyltransferase